MTKKQKANLIQEYNSLIGCFKILNNEWKSTEGRLLKEASVYAIRDALLKAGFPKVNINPRKFALGFELPSKRVVTCVVTIGEKRKNAKV